MSGRKGILKPDLTNMCKNCNERPAGDGGGFCSVCIIHKKRGVKIPHVKRPGQTPPPPRTPGYDKRTPQKR